MKLEEYLEAIRNCPDEIVEIEDKNSVEGKIKIHRLTAEFGVYDNWAILLNADFEKVVGDLKKGDYWVYETHKHSRGVINLMRYKPGSIQLQVMPFVAPFCCTGQGIPETKSEKEHYERQIEDFNISLSLHPNQKKKVARKHPYVVMAEVIADISKMNMEKNIPLCFPKSRGWKNRDDLSQIVYWPEGEQK